jgi:hypothetical protein
MLRRAGREATSGKPGASGSVVLVVERALSSEARSCLFFMENVWFIAALWMALAFLASVVSIWTGVFVALIEILAGVLAGNFFIYRQIQIGLIFWPCWEAESSLF